MAHRIVFAVVFVTALCFGQGTTSVLHFAPADSPQDMREIVNSIGAVTGLPASFDPTLRTLTLSGSSDQVALGDWIFTGLEKPLGGQPSGAMEQYQFSPNETVRILRATNTLSPVQLQEIVNTMRALAEVVKLMPYASHQAVVLGGNPDRVALATWLFNTLDQPEQATNPAEYRTADGLARVFFLHTQDAEKLHQILNVVRASTGLTHLMPFPTQHAISLRGTEAQVALAQNLITDLDK
jgi:type II secretory pathway component GspD/PulD (secretin)